MLQSFPIMAYTANQLQHEYSCNYDYSQQSLVAAQEPRFADVVDRFAFGDSVLGHHNADNVRPWSVIHWIKQHFLLHTKQPSKQCTLLISKLTLLPVLQPF